MEFIKIITACFLLVVVHARHHNRFSDELVKELVEDIIEKEAEKELFNIQDPVVIDKSDPNFKMCWAAEINCEHCSQCGPNKNGGWCVSDLQEQPGPQCICNYGWTGKNAKYIPDTDTSYHQTGWGRNRLRADSCDVPCHYTYDVKNATCLDFCALKPSHPDCKQKKGCHKDCGKYNGICTEMNPSEDRCLCCRGWSGPNPVWSDKHGRYWADYCDTECQWLNGRNDQCKKRPDPVPECNPKCTVENNGKCLPTGRCECCRDWTGPNAEHGTNGKIQADYCDVYCPFTKDTHRHDLCVREDYIKRRRDAGHAIKV